MTLSCCHLRFGGNDSHFLGNSLCFRSSAERPLDNEQRARSVGHVAQGSLVATAPLHSNGPPSGVCGHLGFVVQLVLVRSALVTWSPNTSSERPHWVKKMPSTIWFIMTIGFSWNHPSTKDSKEPGFSAQKMGLR